MDRPAVAASAIMTLTFRGVYTLVGDRNLVCTCAGMEEYK